ncbi:hypothetical protein [Mucilaginibacter sp. 10I4]|nr:hypothetical protein [Mucilaginibacter sp. 10I4]MEB0263395.1 hypothetical protein [Mucilaginibacter sp. 10I4]MEB0278576.1 hypothetical protein [Mucilaginibacter sp. 10B2]
MDDKIVTANPNSKKLGVRHSGGPGVWREWRFSFEDRACGEKR